MSENQGKPDTEGVFKRFCNTQKREAKHIIAELLAVRGLMPLLMKPRNGDSWTPAERAELLVQLRRLSRLSPYLLFLLIPGSALLLPAYAWWLDRRRGVRPGEQKPAQLPDSQRP
jgi:hypothetical protein